MCISVDVNMMVKSRIYDVLICLGGPISNKVYHLSLSDDGVLEITLSDNGHNWDLP